MRNTLLGPYGKATVVLFTSQFETQLPKLVELKKRLGITDGKYYSSNGNFMQSIACLDEAVGTARKVAHPLSSFRRSTRCSHILVTVADVHSDLFALIKYSAELLEGFNLTEPALKQLTDLLDRRREIAWMRQTCSEWAETLTEHIAKAKDMGLTDPSILEADVNAVSSITDPYALEAIAQVNAEIVGWHERHRWRTVQEATSLLANPVEIRDHQAVADEELA